MVQKLYQRMFFFWLTLSSIVAMTNCLTIDCKYSDIVWSIDTFYTCKGFVSLVGDPKEVTYVSQNHKEGRNNDDVQAVMIFNHNLTFAPRNIQKFFRNLKAYSLFNNTIKELTRECLTGLNQLRYFNFLYNHLEIVESDLFIENPLLEWIDFGYNSIRHVGHNTFEHLNFLKTLNFTLTTCINQSAIDSSSVELLKFKLIVSCPPTFQMTETKILKGTELPSEIERQITGRIDPLTKMLLEIGEKLRALEQRINILEGV